MYNEIKRYFYNGKPYCLTLALTQQGDNLVSFPLGSTLAVVIMNIGFNAPKCYLTIICRSYIYLTCFILKYTVISLVSKVNLSHVFCYKNSVLFLTKSI